MATSEIEVLPRERWRKAFIGPLPPDFLRIDDPKEQQEAADCQTAMSLYHQVMQQYVAPASVGRLNITCVQARLAKNYGLVRMDPYVRIRVGHYVYETETHTNGCKNPHWNRVIQTQLPAGVHSISVEIFDECSFKMDELVAWCKVNINAKILCGETHEEWYPLSGKQGDGLEGAINLVLSFSNQPIAPYMCQAIQASPTMVMVPPGRPIFVTPAQAPVIPKTVIPPFVINEAELKQIEEMFPNLPKDVVKVVYEAKRGNKDAAVNALLQMND